MSDSNGSEFKECPQCQRILPLTDYHRNRARPDGRAFYRKPCTRQRLEDSRRRRGVKEQRRATAAVPPGMKWCPDCDAIKPLDEFPRTTGSASGRHSYCKPCHNVRGRASVEKRGGSRHYHLMRRYGIGVAEFEELLAEQGGVCAICGAADPEHVDHDHGTGYIRGILCFNCNGGLGQFRDNAGYLTTAIDYLRDSTCRVLIHPGVYQVRSPRRGRRPSRSS